MNHCPKHAEFHSKKKFEKLVHLVDFVIRNHELSYRVKPDSTLVWEEKKRDLPRHSWWTYDHHRALNG
jgi:hypothetical protein